MTTFHLGDQLTQRERDKRGNVQTLVHKANSLQNCAKQARMGRLGSVETTPSFWATPAKQGKGGRILCYLPATLNMIKLTKNRK